MQGHTSMYTRECCRGRTKSKFQVHQIINAHFHFHRTHHSFHQHILFSHISNSFPTPQNSVAKSTRHLFISKRVSPDPRPAKCFYVQEIVIPEQIHVTQTKPGGIVRRTAASSPSTGHFPDQVTSARRCP